MSKEILSNSYQPKTADTQNLLNTEKSYFHDHSPFDRIFDKALKTIGITEEQTNRFLSSHKRGTRIAANTLSIGRIVLGEVAIRKFERAKKENNKKEIIESAIALSVIMATDGVDGFITRKAGIDNSRSGKNIDSLSDVAMRLRLAVSSIVARRDKLDAIRGAGEILVFKSAIPQILKASYTSTTEGKIRMNTDAAVVITNVLKAAVPPDNCADRLLTNISDGARVASTVLALADGIKRRRQRKLKLKRRSTKVQEVLYEQIRAERTKNLEA